jgi:hypothetical protein
MDVILSMDAMLCMDVMNSVMMDPRRGKATNESLPHETTPVAAAIESYEVLVPRTDVP